MDDIGSDEDEESIAHLDALNSSETSVSSKKGYDFISSLDTSTLQQSPSFAWCYRVHHLMPRYVLRKHCHLRRKMPISDISDASLITKMDC